MTESKEQGKLWKVLATLAAAVVGPVLGGLGLAEWAKTHIALSAALLVLYETIVFLVYIAGKIWRRLEDPWLDSVAAWIDYQLQELVSGYRRRYLEQVIFACRSFDLKGLITQGDYTPDLERVFVELFVFSAAPHRASAASFSNLPFDLRAGHQTIWEHLKAGRNLALIGGPGSGKTTLLRHIALSMASRHKHGTIKDAPRRFPILLFLRHHGREIANNPDLSLAKLIESSEITTNVDHVPPNDWFGHQLRKGRCLVLLDGLDEVTNREVRLRVVLWLERQMLEPISKIPPHQDEDTSELQHAKEVGLLVFPSGYQTTKVMQPSKEPFYFPAVTKPS